MLSLAPLSLIGTLAAVVMIAGYMTYAWHLYTCKIRANAAAWLMMSMSTIALFVAEFLYGVPWNALKADAADAISALCIMLLAYYVGRLLFWTRHDVYIISVFVILLCLYLLGDYAVRHELISGTIHIIGATAIIIVYNVAILLEFWPLIRETILDSSHELPTAWIVWTASYILYFIVRVGEQVAWVNLLHPILGVALHAIMALLTISATRRHILRFFRVHTM